MKPFEILKKYNIYPKKKLGQNFLIDKNILEKLEKALNLDADDIIFEIGAGFGIITEALAKVASNVTAVEYDKTLIPILENEISAKYKNVKIIHDNVLNISLEQLFQRQKKKIKIFGNLPYYITTKIIFNIINSSYLVDYAIFTMQSEVADRLLAKPGGKDYGRLTVSVSLYAKVEKLFNINRNSFYPIPGVGSTVVKFKFFSPPKINYALFFNLLKALFGKRRKYILNGLMDLEEIKIPKIELEAYLNKIDISANVRAEDLTLDNYISLTNMIDTL